MPGFLAGISPALLIVLLALLCCGSFGVLWLIGASSNHSTSSSSSQATSTTAHGYALPPPPPAPTYSKQEIESAVLDTCKKAVKKDLKDPDSAKFSHDWKVWIVTQRDRPPKVSNYHPENGDKLYSAAGGVNATNGFGGYIGDEMWGCDAVVNTSGSGNVHANAYPLS